MNTHPLIAWMQAVNDTLVDHLDRQDRRLIELGEHLTAFSAAQALAVKCDGNHAAPACLDPQCWHKGAPEDKWAKERAAFAAGKRIQIRNYNDDPVNEWTGWIDLGRHKTPEFFDMPGVEYRIHPEDLTPDRCPKCGCTKEAPDNEHCRDPFHTPSDAATPAPEPWRPKYAVGCEVHMIDALEIGVVKGHILKDGITLVKWPHIESICHENELFLHPVQWTMPTPPAGHEWHRNDFTEVMLPAGTRPLCEGEDEQPGDEYAHQKEMVWHECDELTVSKAEDFSDWYFRRTTRPAPSPAQAEPTAQTDESFSRDFVSYVGFNPATAQTAVTAQEAYEHHVASRNETRHLFYAWNELDPDPKQAWEKSVEFITQRVLAQSSRTEPKPFPTPQDVMQAASKKHSRIEQEKRNVEQASGGKKSPFVTFDCHGGYPQHQEDAKKVFTVGAKYRVLRAHVSQSMTRYVIDGKEGTWNSCLFSGDIPDELCDDFLKSKPKQASGELPSVEELKLHSMKQNGDLVYGRREMAIISAVREACIRVMSDVEVAEFRECATCAHKPGSPPLCESCFHNRHVISSLKQRAEAAEQTISDLRRELHDAGESLGEMMHQRNSWIQQCDKLKAEFVARAVKIHQINADNFKLEKERDEARIGSERRADEIKQLSDHINEVREELAKANQHTEDVFERYTEGVLKMVCNLGSKAEIDTSPGETEHETRGHILARAEDAIQALLDEARESLRKVESGMLKDLQQSLIEKRAMVNALQAELASLKASSGWVALSERRPTMEDADDCGRIIWRKLGKEHLNFGWNAIPPDSVEGWFWLPLKPLPTPPPSPEEGERKEFEKEWSHYRLVKNVSDSFKSMAYDFWQAARKTKGAP